MEKVSKIESGLKHSIKNKTIAAARLVVVGAALAFVEDKRYPHHYLHFGLLLLLPLLRQPLSLNLQRL